MEVSKGHWKSLFSKKTDKPNRAYPPQSNPPYPVHSSKFHCRIKKRCILLRDIPSPKIVLAMRQAIVILIGLLLLAVQPTVFAQCHTNNAAGCSCPTPGATNCILLPDILAGKKTLNAANGWSEYGQLANGINRGLLRIDVSTPNVGWGPLEVSPTNDYVCGSDTLRNFTPPGNFLCPDGSYPKRLIKQKLYQKVGNTFQYVLRDAGWMQYHPSHGHIHIDGWGLYTLRLKDASVADTLQWPIVNEGVKVSFCLIDLTSCSGSMGDCVSPTGAVLNNGSFPNFGLGGGYNCGNTRQGISVGMVDIYDRSLDESFVRVPYEACNGSYFVMVQVDPDNHFQEMNENNNWLAAQVPLTQQRTAGTGPYSYIFSKAGNLLCPGSQLELQASGASSYLWSNGATTQKTTINIPGKYWVRATTPCGTATSDTLVISSSTANGTPAVIKADSICSGDRAKLYASGNAHWYDAPTNGNLVFVGNTFETGTLVNNTTFYVADQPSVIGGSLGPANTRFSGSGNFTTNRADYLIFNAFQPFKLKKITVEANAAGSRQFELRTMYGDVMAKKLVTVAAGVQEVELDFFVPAGLNLQLGVGSPTPTTPGLYSSTTAAANIGYPYKVSSVANIVGSSLGDKVYPFCYNWVIEGTPQPCNVNVTRSPVTAVVTPRPTLSLTGLQPNYLHHNGPSQLVATPPGGVLTGKGLVGNTFYPKLAGVGSHAIQYSYQAGKCSSLVTRFTTVDIDNSLVTDGFALELFGNPGGQPMLYVVSPLSSAIQVRLLSDAGQLLQRYSFSAGSGSNWFRLDTRGLARGLYLVEVLHQQTGKRKTMKLLY
jgi:hypothetical protein